ncbi:MAG: DUF2332 family protein [Caulobacteraceae bacterium]
MSDRSEMARAFGWQIAGCEALGAPFSASMMERALADAEVGGPTAALLIPWRSFPAKRLIADAVPLRLLGGLHDLVLSGEVPALSEAYPAPGRGGDADAAWAAARAALPANHARLAAFMTHEPQTNEVRRSACLLGGFLSVVARTGLPLRCFEVGASAGLNQLWDRYRYALGDLSWGDPDAPVLIDTDWRGSPPPLPETVAVSSRAACDRKPVDLADPDARRRLRAYVWPDQPDRLARLDAAIGAARGAAIRVEREDAVTWAAHRARPETGAATVLYHSVFWQYLPAESQAALADALTTLGAAATAEAPFAWLRMEPPPDNMGIMEVRLTLWPGGEEHLLAHVHPHGAWVDWLADVPQ